MYKIGMLHPQGTYFDIYYDDKAKNNPYRVYRRYWDRGWHKRLLAKYGNLSSCTAYIHTYVQFHDEESR